ncbi:MAG: hypothetical protein HUJ51_02035, partial [Eggerthellaceae bacterium]|nr:hypothetical protein [Eggerthellaceae bacterium]
MKKINNSTIPSFLFQENDLVQFFKPKLPDAHKGDRGYAAIIAGSVHYSGASKLSNLAACACGAGAGVVKLAVPESIKDAVMPHLFDSTLFPLSCRNNDEYIFDEEQSSDLMSKCKCVACGMGMGRSDELTKLVGFLLENYQGILVLDADATWAYAQLAREEGFRGQLDYLKRKCQFVLTPHFGEFAFMVGEDIETIKKNSVDILQKFAKKNY